MKESKKILLSTLSSNNNQTLSYLMQRVFLCMKHNRAICPSSPNVSFWTICALRGHHHHLLLAAVNILIEVLAWFINENLSYITCRDLEKDKSLTNEKTKENFSNKIMIVINHQQQQNPVFCMEANVFVVGPAIYSLWLKSTLLYFTGT